MHTNQLETFLWVATLKNFHAAAGRLNLTQPAISARIAALEAELGTKLLNRHGTQIALTKDGLDAMRYAQEVLRLTKDLKRQKRDLESGQKTLRIGIVETLAYAWVSSLIKRIRIRFPRIGIELVTDSTSNLHRHLIRREIDIAFVVGVVYEPNVRCIWLAQYDLKWLASPAIRVGTRSVSLKELAKHVIVTYEEGTHINYEVKTLFKSNGLWPVRVIGCTATGIIIELVRKGIGIGVLPAATASEAIRLGEIKVLTSKSRLPKFDVCVSYPLDSPNGVSRTVAEIGQTVCESFQMRLLRRVRG